MREVIAVDSVYFYASSSILQFVFTLVLFAVLFLFATEHTPFDLVEAESELIDGVTTDVTGL